MCTIAVRVSSVWNFASTFGHIFGYSVPQISEEPIKKAKIVLEKTDDTSLVKDLVDKSSADFNDVGLQTFKTFIAKLENEKKHKVCHCHN